MLNGLFNPSSYFFNPYAVPNLVVAIYCFFLAGFSLMKKKKQGVSLFCLTFSCGVYFFTFFMAYSSFAASLAQSWIKLGYVLFGVPFIVISSYFFSLEVTGMIASKKLRMLMYSGFVIMAIFAFLTVTTDWVYKFPPRHFFWGYHPNPSFLFYAFFPLWISFALLGEYCVYYSYRKQQDPLEKNRLRIFFVTFLLGYTGAADFLGVYGIEFYPIGSFSGGIYLSLIVYNFIKYKALGIETVFHKTLLWFTSVIVIILPAGVITFLISKALINVVYPSVIIAIFSITFFAFSYYYYYLRPRIDNFFGRKQYAYYELLGRVSETVSTTLDIGEFSRKLLQELDACILPQKIYLWLIDEKTQQMAIFAGKIFPEEVWIDTRRQQTLDNDDLLLNHVSASHSIIETPLVERNPESRYLANSNFFRFLKEEQIEAVVPLVMEERLMGILGLGRKRSLRVYSKGDLEILDTLGGELGTSIYNALHHQDILEKQRLQQEIFLAKNIQESFLPKEPPRIPGISLYGLYSPAKEIGGDYYDFMPVSDSQKVYVTIGDVSGKGLDAGLVVSSLKSSLLALVKFTSSPREILILLNDILFKEIREQKFVSFLLLMYESNQNILKYSSCGHEHIILCRKGRVESVKSGGVIMGMLENIQPFLEENSLDLSPGDKVLLYTDGATEARSPQEELYGFSRLIESFQKHSHLSIKDIIHNVHQDIKEFISTRDQYDDITLVGIQKE